MKISVIIPVYNEERFIIKVLEKVNLQKKVFDIEILISDDCSQDQTINLLKKNPDLYDKLIESSKNLGKGSAIKRAIPHVTGDVVLIQDADLEYDPKDYKKILEPFFDDDADVVYGTRFRGGEKVRIFYFINRIANFVITLLVNLFTNTNFTDVETGFKAFKANHIKKINLNENSFAIEIELTMKISKIPNLKIYEVGISYSGRTYEEGKKIRAKDGLIAILSIFKYFFKK